MDAFFSGVVELPHDTYRKAGVLAVEMEIAALYIVQGVRRQSEPFLSNFVDTFKR